MPLFENDYIVLEVIANNRKVKSIAVAYRVFLRLYKCCFTCVGSSSSMIVSSGLFAFMSHFSYRKDSASLLFKAVYFRLRWVIVTVLGLSLVGGEQGLLLLLQSAGSRVRGLQ